MAFRVAERAWDLKVGPGGVSVPGCEAHPCRMWSSGGRQERTRANGGFVPRAASMSPPPGNANVGGVPEARGRSGYLPGGGGGSGTVESELAGQVNSLMRNVSLLAVRRRSESPFALSPAMSSAGPSSTSAPDPPASGLGAVYRTAAGSRASPPPEVSFRKHSRSPHVTAPAARPPSPVPGVLRAGEPESAGGGGGKGVARKEQAEVQLKAAEAALKERGRHVTQLEQSVRTLTRQLDASGVQIDTLQVLLNGSLNGAIQSSE